MLLLLSTQPDAVQAYDTTAGTVVLVVGGGVSFAAYRASVRRRLEQLGGAATVEQFRAEQVVWGAFGLAAALAALQVATGSRPQPVAVLVSAGVLTALGVLGRDRWLTRQVSRREQSMREESPTLAELQLQDR